MKKILLCCLMTLGLITAACGSDSGTSDVDRAAWKGDTPLTKGKIGVLNVLASSEVQSHWTSTAQKAIEAIGWEHVTVDGKGDPAVEGQALNSFVQQQVDAILIVGGVAPQTIASQLRAAKAAQIPVVTTGVRSPNEGGEFDGVFAPADGDFGTVMAKYLVKKLPPKSPWVALLLTAAEGGNAPNVTALPVLEKAGHKRVGTVDLELSGDLASQAQKAARDLLTAHPDAKLLFGCCDFTPAVTVPALRQAGREDVIHSVRYDNLSTLKLIRDGSPVVTAAANADAGVLEAISQIVAHTTNGSKIAKSAPEDLWEFTVVDKTNLPEEGEFFFDPDEQIATWVTKLQTEYSR